MFEALKAFFVKRCKECNVCCCKYHFELDLLKQGINNTKDAKKGYHAINVCGCECFVCKVIDSNLRCQTHDKMHFGVTMLRENCLCPKLKFQEWHKLECPMGDCLQCGANTYLFAPRNLFILMSG